MLISIDDPGDEILAWMGCSGSIMVCIFAFYFGDPSSNPAGYQFRELYNEKMNLNEKVTGVGPLKILVLIYLDSLSRTLCWPGVNFTCEKLRGILPGGILLLALIDSF